MTARNILRRVFFFAAALLTAGPVKADVPDDFLKYLAENDMLRLEQLIRKNARKLNLERCVGRVLNDSPQGFNKSNTLAALTVLVKNGADVHRATTRFGNVSPLWLLAASGSELTVRQRLAIAVFLLDGGADVNTTYGDFTPPLIAAATSGHAELVTLLVERGAYLDKRSNTGDTALIAAAREDRTRIARYLAGQGANINLRNMSGETAMSVAYERGNLSLYNHLKDLGAYEFEPSRAVSPAAAPQSPPPRYRFDTQYGAYNIGGVYVSAAGGRLIINGNGTTAVIRFTDPYRRLSTGNCSLSDGMLNIIYTNGPLSGRQVIYTIDSAGQLSNQTEVFKK